MPIALELDTIQGRARSLIDIAGMDTLVREGSIGYSRWQSVRYKDIRMSKEELEVLEKLYPQHALWLISGRTVSEYSQTKPGDVVVMGDPECL